MSKVANFRVELALSSERMKQNVQAARAKTVYTMNIRERGTNIKLDPGGIQVFCGIKSWNFAPEWYERNGFSLGHWLNRPNPRQSVFQNLITNFERLKQLTPPSFLIINCYIDLMKNVTIRQVIDTPELQNWDQIYFYGIENTGEAWKWINEISMRPELRVDFDCDWIMVEKRFCKVPEF
ncbi:hypothetical protein B9Z55_005108 [Caenorhabditis nigoni]|uniref:Uncharacterized protein n=1 Tax=Caenorhabditis nigoni TaxID=1611254 RepID=A0A2G5UZT7_9PELO|nr:hypothetical protein B9Z55_005108 [Caenorhabditis nigoni]